MYLWRRNYPRVRYQPVVAIHGIFYVVKDEIVVKHGEWWEWIYPSSMQPHLRYNPRHLPAIIQEKPEPWKSLDCLQSRQAVESSPQQSSCEPTRLANPFLRTS